MLPFIKVSTHKKKDQSSLKFDEKLAFFPQCIYTLVELSFFFETSSGTNRFSAGYEETHYIVEDALVAPCELQKIKFSIDFINSSISHRGAF